MAASLASVSTTHWQDHPWDVSAKFYLMLVCPTIHR
jgi:hypothetical protein